MNDMYAKVKEKYVEARKARSKWASTYSLIVAEMDSVVKNKSSISDSEVVSITNKMIKNLRISVDMAKSAGVEYQRYLDEVEELKSLLPAQMPVDALKEIIYNRIVEGFDMKGIMQFLKENHSGHYDAKIAAQIIKENLK